MRFYQLLIIFILLIVMVLIGLVVVWSQFALTSAVWRFEKDVQQLVRLSKAKKPPHAEECQIPDEEKLFGEEEELPLMGYQLRFVNDEEYVIEAVCRFVNRSPIVIDRKQLSMNVVKLTGSGIFYPVPGARGVTGMVMLGRDGFMKEVGLRDGIVYSRTVFDSSSFDIGPQAAVTTCEGWGWQCCSPLTQAGVGEVQKQVLDCRENCYTACVDRPILSLFNTEPFMDTNSRVVRLPRTEQRVKFAYRVISLSVPLQMVRVHTGDGRVYERFDETGVVEHRYACTGTCVYDAYVEATDESELGLGESRLRRIRVVVE